MISAAAEAGGRGRRNALTQLNTEIVLLMHYDDDLDEAALACRSAEDFGLVWQIKGRVANDIQKRRTELLQQIQDQLAPGAHDPAGQDAVAGLKQFASTQKRSR